MIDRAEHPIQETARNLGPALLVVTFDAIFAFAALHFAKVPMIRDFGLLLAVGIAAICLGSIILPLAILGIREFKSPTKGSDFREGPLGPTRRVARQHPGAVRRPARDRERRDLRRRASSVEDKLTLQTDPVQWVNQDSPDHQGHPRGRGARRIGSSELGVFVHEPTTCSPTSSCTFVARLHPRHAARSTRRRCSPARASRRRSATSSRRARAPPTSRRRATTCAPPTTSRPPT